jgi:hypothetical protein
MDRAGEGCTAHMACPLDTCQLLLFYLDPLFCSTPFCSVHTLLGLNFHSLLSQVILFALMIVEIFAACADSIVEKQY